MSILKEIYNYKLDFVSKKKKLLPQNNIESKISLSKYEGNFFSKKLNSQKNRISIIGEIKKASPSLGKFVNDDIDLIKIAKEYEKSDISCISILTDEKYFNGKIADLKKIKKNVSIPILRKDFIVDEYQIYESKLYGADCILIILSMLKDNDAKKFISIANDLNMDTIVEVHNIEELERSKKMNSNLLGINNRNLNDFTTNIEITINLMKEIENNEKLLISESGFHSKNDVYKIAKTTGINNYLIGEYLMKSKNLKKNISNLLN